MYAYDGRGDVAVNKVILSWVTDVLLLIKYSSDIQSLILISDCCYLLFPFWTSLFPCLPVWGKELQLLFFLDVLTSVDTLSQKLPEVLLFCFWNIDNSLRVLFLSLSQFLPHFKSGELFPSYLLMLKLQLILTLTLLLKSCPHVHNV